MRGHIRKDYYLAKKTLMLMGAALFFITALSYLFRFAFDYGNLRNGRDAISTCDIIFSVLPAAVFLFCSVIITIDSVLQDKKEKWNLFLFSLPLSNRQIVLYKLAEVYLLWLSGNAVLLMLDCIYGAVFGFLYVKTGLYILMLISAVTLLLNLASIPFSYRYQSQNAVIGMLLACFFVPAYGAAAVWVLHLADTNADMPDGSEALVPILTAFFENYGGVLAAGALLLIILCTAVCYASGLRLIERVKHNI